MRLSFCSSVIARHANGAKRKAGHDPIPVVKPTRPVSKRNFALAGYRQHGVLTYAILDALTEQGVQCRHDLKPLCLVVIDRVARLASETRGEVPDDVLAKLKVAMYAVASEDVGKVIAEVEEALALVQTPARKMAGQAPGHRLSRLGGTIHGRRRGQLGVRNFCTSSRHDMAGGLAP